MGKISIDSLFKNSKKEVERNRTYYTKALFREESNIKGFCRDFGIGQGNTFFMTITFKDNITDKAEAVKYWNKFRTQLTKRYRIFRYICVYERQKRGAWHLHILCNAPAVPSMKKFKIVYKEILKNSTTQIGIVQSKWTYGNDKSIGSYMFKYLTKQDREPYVRYVNYSRNFLRCCSSQFMFLNGAAGLWRGACRTLDEMFPKLFKYFYFNSTFDDRLIVVNGCQGDLKSFLKSLEVMRLYFEKRASCKWLSDMNYDYLMSYCNLLRSMKSTYDSIYPTGQLEFKFVGV